MTHKSTKGCKQQKGSSIFAGTSTDIAIKQQKIIAAQITLAFCLTLCIENMIFRKVFPSKTFATPTTNFLTTLANSNTNYPDNEPFIDYTKPQEANNKKKLDDAIEKFKNTTTNVPIVINGKQVTSDLFEYQAAPFDHTIKLAKFYYANQDQINLALDTSFKASQEWNSSTSLEDRCLLFERAANLAASDKFRHQLNAATMLGQAKTIEQAEIDSACELVDFLRFNAFFLRNLINFTQPKSTNTSNNSIKFRPLDGFVASVSPFNFTAIGANLATAPVLFGNSVIWKPSDGSLLANYITYQMLQEAGFPPNLISFVPSDGLIFGKLICSHPKLAAINFTGSVDTFRWLWREIGTNIGKFDSFPRLIGETGGKNYHFVHESANIDLVVDKTIKSAFEYSGQKCSACSRLFVPRGLWEKSIKTKLLSACESLKFADPTQPNTFASAVINRKAFDRIKGYIEYGRSEFTNEAGRLKLLIGGETDNTMGFYIRPTIFETTSLDTRLMTDEIFGPVLTVFVYDESKCKEMLQLVSSSSKFALTGSIFGQDEEFITEALGQLAQSAGNFYINDKSTGASVAQQPFGGSKLSGTNDKAGGPHYLMRFCNQQSIKRSN